MSISTTVEVNVGRMALRSLTISLALTVAIVTVFWLINGAPRLPLGWLARAYNHPHAPNLKLLATASMAIKIHLATVLAAFAIATAQMVLPKGRDLHRVMGWTLATLLIITATASLFIRNPTGGFGSPFIVFSVWTLVGVPMALAAARAHKVRRHAGIMTGFYTGALVIAGVLTLIPGRLLWWVFFG